MRTNTILISERELMYSIGGQLFAQAPNKAPRNVVIIMKKVRDAFRKNAYNDNEYYSLRIPKNELHEYIDKLLKNIPEFCDLNLSQNEYEKNIVVDDPSRAKYITTSAHDKYTPESWKNDIIDLDAFVSNVVSNICYSIRNNSDCFGCIYDKNKLNKKCKNCIINPDLQNNLEYDYSSNNNGNLLCKYPCPIEKIICCSICSKKSTCKYACNNNFNKCPNAITTLTNKLK